MFYVAKETPPSLEQTPPLPGQSEQQASRLVGVSMWLYPEPPSEPESWYSYYQHWVLYLRQILNNVRYLGYGGLNVKRYWIWKSRQAEAQRKILTDRRGYYWCGILAVNPEMRRKGLGRKLVEIMTDRADREGMKCYLESSKLVPNVDIYRKMGFETALELACDDEGNICKVRPPPVSLSFVGIILPAVWYGEPDMPGLCLLHSQGLWIAMPAFCPLKACWWSKTTGKPLLTSGLSSPPRYTA